MTRRRLVQLLGFDFRPDPLCQEKEIIGNKKIQFVKDASSGAAEAPGNPAPAVRHILITGFPGIGKTTLAKRVSGELGEFHPIGFYTSEIREGGMRRGFELVSLDGRKGLLSHVDINTPYRVGRYRVDVIAFDGFLATLPFLDPSTNLIVIDEIGRMECLSRRFTGLVRELLDSGKVLIATVSLKGGGLIEEVKKRKDVLTFLMTEGNRDSLVPKIADTIRVMHRQRSE